MQADAETHNNQVRPSSLLAEHHDAIVALAARHGATSIAVFGSVARNQDRLGSDLDLLVTLAPGRSLFDLGALSMALAQVLGIRVDVFTPSMLRPEIRARAIEEARPL